jgi:hypothetical protein
MDQWSPFLCFKVRLVSEVVIRFEFSQIYLGESQDPGDDIGWEFTEGLFVTRFLSIMLRCVASNLV